MDNNRAVCFDCNHFGVGALSKHGLTCFEKDDCAQAHVLFGVHLHVADLGEDVAQDVDVPQQRGCLERVVSVVAGGRQERHGVGGQPVLRRPQQEQLRPRVAQQKGLRTTTFVNPSEMTRIDS